MACQVKMTLGMHICAKSPNPKAPPAQGLALFLWEQRKGALDPCAVNGLAGLSSKVSPLPGYSFSHRCQQQVSLGTCCLLSG